MEAREKYLVDTGRLILETQLRVNPFSAFFQYGYGVFETIRFGNWGAQLYFLEAHLERLRNTCRELRLAFPPLSVGLIKQLLFALREKNSMAEENGLLKVMVVQEAPARYFLLLRSLSRARAVKLYDTNYLILSKTARYKTLNYLEPFLREKELRRRVKKTALEMELDILKKSGMRKIVEAGRGNLIVYQRETLYFISGAGPVLNGITQQVLLKKLSSQLSSRSAALAGKLKAVAFKDSFGKRDLLTAEEVSYINASGVKAVVSLDDRSLKRSGVSEQLNAVVLET